MRHYFHLLVVALALFVAPLGSASIVYAQATDLHDAAAQLTKKLTDDPDVQKIVGEHIVVAPFENINGKGDAVPRILQEMFTTDFIKAKHFKVLERDQLQSSLDELHFQLSDLADPAKAKKIGKLAGAAYVLLGSISDTGSSTFINARIVSIESGENVAAEDEDIKTGDAPLAASGLNPALGHSSPPDNALPVTTPAVPSKTPASIDLNASANPKSAGQFTGKRDNFGLLGGTNFQISWREDLGRDQICSFAAGDLLGDGSSRLALGKIDSGNKLSIQKWNGNKFAQTWISEPVPSGDNIFVRVLPQLKAPAYIFHTDWNKIQSIFWLWNGNNYIKNQNNVMSVSDTIVSPLGNLVGRYYTPYLKTGIFKVAANDSKSSLDQTSERGSELFNTLSDTVAADFDGDGKIELAIAQETDIKLPGTPIEIYSLDGVRKAITPDGYGARIAVWNPSASKHPLLVACRNDVDADGKPNGGFVYFIQWNGESYEEVWKSNQIGDAVIDMQVCDPKGEGKPGLVILSKQKDDYYLTKIVLGK